MGGSCSSVAPKQANNDPNMTIGQTKEIQDGCGPKGTVKNHLNRYIPQNGEYEWGGEGGDCYYDGGAAGNSMTCSAGCSSAGHCAIIGSKGKYKRISYNADQVDCCLGKYDDKGMIGAVTCDPAYRNMNSNECKSMIQSRCSQAGKIFSEDYCTKYCNDPANKEWCDGIKLAYCNTPTNFLQADCIGFCNPLSKCSNAVQAFCQKDKNMFTDPKCISYCSSNSVWCDDQKQKFCNNAANINDPVCREWCKSNKDKCVNGLQALCSVDDKVFSDELCLDYCSSTNGKPWCETRKGQFCNDAKNTPVDKCQTWCRENMGKCDDGMAQYCNGAGKGKDICKCLNSPAAKYNPLCIDAECSTKGYANNSMIVGRGSGCQIVDCSQYLDLKDVVAGGQVKLDTKFEQQCGNTFKEPPKPPAAPPVPANSSNQPTPSSTQPSTQPSSQSPSPVSTPESSTHSQTTPAAVQPATSNDNTMLIGGGFSSSIIFCLLCLLILVIAFMAFRK
ncbi:putative myristylated protein [Fadolivirus algeromassiliense]|jgi:hypothetical protein|uniref:Myristylated protein n=1 Tax=Fadolivirus FV1/VV64 TaxID=3070911 RepID=A0A7D3QWM4_9VIRU|nr:putative myristylated protein [Fadolivirus algeromassiliense]QKF94719.1 putative myristylated protein [Fadolivirus FV1/VV64]